MFCWTLSFGIFCCVYMSIAFGLDILILWGLAVPQIPLKPETHEIYMIPH